MPEDTPTIQATEAAGTLAWWGFGLLALAMLVAFAVAIWWRWKANRDGIYSKYKLPSDPGRRGRPGAGGR